MEHAAPPAWVMLAYLISGVFFILALRGLSSPATSQQGNRFGMAGMLIAVVTTLVTHLPGENPCDTLAATNTLGFCEDRFFVDWQTALQILGAIAIGGGIGWVTARKIAMTDMPQLVAAFHSLVGMAAVLVAAAAFLNPVAFGIIGEDGLITPSVALKWALVLLLVQ